MSTLVITIISLCIIGVVAAVILYLVAQKFKVEEDPRIDIVNELLPGANCGGCGFPGCMALAESIAKGESSVNACPVGGEACAVKIGDIMGVAAGGGDKIVADVICMGNCESAKEKYVYEGINDCRAAAALSGGSKACSYGCLGLGTCKDVCDFDAIDIVDGVAVINEDNCVMCGKCVDICPKHVIAKKPEKKTVVVKCNSKDFGKAVKDKCTVGCIGCGVCVKMCKFDAIIFEDKIAKVDYDKCVECQACVMKCPVKVIKGRKSA